MTSDSAGQQLTIAGLQVLIAEMYSQKDKARGVDGTFMWLMEEVGELAADRALIVHELVPLRASLEDAFMELTRDSVEYRTQEAS